MAQMFQNSAMQWLIDPVGKAVHSNKYTKWLDPAGTIVHDNPSLRFLDPVGSMVNPGLDKAGSGNGLQGPAPAQRSMLGDYVKSKVRSSASIYGGGTLSGLNQ